MGLLNLCTMVLPYHWWHWTNFLLAWSGHPSSQHASPALTRPTKGLELQKLLKVSLKLCDYSRCSFRKVIEANMHLPMHAVQLTNRPQHTGGLPRSAVYVPPSAWRVAQFAPVAGPPGRRTVSTCSAESQAQAVPTPEVLAKDNEYNQQMKQQMGWGNLNPYEVRLLSRFQAC